MDNSGLKAILEGVENAGRIYRDRAADEILRHPDLVPELVDMVFKPDNPLHIKAAWVLELVCLQDVALLDPCIGKFISGISLLKHESALRPVSKICFLWSRHHLTRNKGGITLSKPQIEQIISDNFDFLIEDHKVATQVFAMDTLKVWGSEQPWIRQELKLLLQKNADSGTSGYRAHARKLLKNL